MSGYTTVPKNGLHYTTAADRRDRAEKRQAAQAAQATTESLRYQMTPRTPMTPMTPNTEYPMVPPSMTTTPKTLGSSMTPPEMYHMMILPPSTPEPDSDGYGYQVPDIWYPDPEGYHQEPDILTQEYHQEPDILFP